MRKNNGLTTALIIIGAVVLILTLGVAGKNLFSDPHAGHDHSTTTDEHEGHDHTTTAKKPIKDCYTYTEEKNGTYSYVVKARNGSTLLEDYYSKTPVEITTYGDYWVVVSGQTGPEYNKHWTIFCNVEAGISFQKVFGAVGHSEKQIAFVDERNDTYVLLVGNAINLDIIDNDNYAILEGLSAAAGKTPEITSKQEGNKVTVTYTADNGQKKSVSVTLD